MNSTAESVTCFGSLPSKVVRITTYSLLMASSLIGNLLVVGVFYRNKTLRTAVHYFILNMAISDLLYPLVYFPLSLITLTSRNNGNNAWLNQGIWGNVLCQLTWNAASLSTLVSSLSMVFIAVDRFHGVVFSMKAVLFPETKCRFIIACVWLTSIPFSFPISYLIIGVSGQSGDTKLFRCVLSSRLMSRETNWMRGLLIFDTCLLFGSAITVTVLYSSVVVRLYRQKRQLNLSNEQIQRRNKNNRRIIWMLSTVVILFYFVWIQFVSVLFLVKSNVNLPCIYRWLAEVAILPLYTVVNPVVYYIYNHQYRQGFKDMLSFCCPCRAVAVLNRSRVDNASHINYAIELQQQ